MKWFNLVILILLIALNLCGLYLVYRYFEPEKALDEPKPVPPILQKIAWCESEGQQFVNEKVVRGRENHQDVGKYQINLDFHESRADKLGFNLFTEEGNESYALWLFEHYGTMPWTSSAPCWVSRY